MSSSVQTISPLHRHSGSLPESPKSLTPQEGILGFTSVSPEVRSPRSQQGRSPFQWARNSISLKAYTVKKNISAMWQRLRNKAVPPEEDYHDLTVVEVNDSGVRCLKKNTMKINNHDEEQFIHANFIEIANEEPSTSAQSSCHFYIAGQSPENYGAAEKFLIAGMESGSGLYQFVSRTTHRNFINGDAISNLKKSGKKSMLQLIRHQYELSKASNHHLVIGGKYTIQNLEKIDVDGVFPDASYDSVNDHCHFLLEYTDRKDGPLKKIILTQAGLDFSEKCLKIPDIKKSKAILDQHRILQNDGTNENPNPIIVSHAGIGRNAALIVYNEIHDLIKSKKVNTPEELNVALEKIIDEGREVRGPGFLHSAHQLQEIQEALSLLRDIDSDGDTSTLSLEESFSTNSITTPVNKLSLTDIHNATSTFTSLNLDMDKTDLNLMGNTDGTHIPRILHHEDNGSWWRSAFLNVFMTPVSTNSPMTLGDRMFTIVSNLGDSFKEEAILLKEMADRGGRKFGEPGLHAVITGLEAGERVKAFFMSDMEASRLKSFGEADDHADRPGETALIKVAKELLKRANLNESRIAELFNKEKPVEGTNAEISLLIKQFEEPDQIFYNRSTRPGGWFDKDSSSLELTYFAPAREYYILPKDENDNSSPIDPNQQFLSRLSRRPVIVAEGGHFKIALPNDVARCRN